MRYTLIVQERILGVLGGNDVHDDRLENWCSAASVIYAADSGADKVIALGHKPVVVGDFDSFESLDQAGDLRLEKSLCQDTTDCDKLLALVALDGHSSVTLIATEGDLPDHVLSTYSSAIESKLKVNFAFRRGIGVLVRSTDVIKITSTPGQRVSLLPLTECHGVSLSGVKWPLSEEHLSLGIKVSISNESNSELIEVSVQKGVALIFVETDRIDWDYS